MPYLLNAAYVLVLFLAAPWLVYCAIFRGKYRNGWAQKLLGLVPRRPDGRPCIWFHAVSVGEINALQPLVRRFTSRYPDWECVISTTTRTGFELANKKYAAHMIVYCPLDFSWAVDRALCRVRPDVLVLTELELWPNLILAAKRHHASVAIVNGRLSDHSARGYGRLVRLIRPILAHLDLVAVQSSEYAERFCRLGAPASRVVVTGSVKFDGAETSRTNLRTTQLAQLAGFTPDDIVLLAGSTQHPEEQMAIETFRALEKRWPRLRLVLAPRHPERFDYVAALLEQSDLPWRRRSRLSRSKSSDDGVRTRVLLVDTIGELAAWWGTAHIAFVGGSMGRRGGQNMIEPAGYAAAISFGPNTKNFRDVVTMLLDAEAAVVVRDGRELTAFVQRCLEEPDWAASLGQKAQHLVLAQAGASDHTLQLIEPLMDRPATSELKASA